MRPKGGVQACHSAPLLASLNDVEKGPDSILKAEIVYDMVEYGAQQLCRKFMDESEAILQV